MSARFARLAAALFAALLFASCTVLRVDSAERPARIESRGLVDSHVAVGIPAEEHVLHLNLFDGSSPGAIGELTIWKLFHLEVGLAGAAIGIGPLHLGLGLLFYDPEIPPMLARDPKPREDATPAPVESEQPADDEPGIATQGS